MAKVKSEKGGTTETIVEKPRPAHKRGYIANTEFPLSPAHKEENGIFFLEERRKRVAKYYLEGWSQWAIARAENVDQATIVTDLNVIYDRWQKEIIQTVDEIKRKEIAEVDRIRQLAIQAYEKSMGQKIVTTTLTESTDTYTKEGNKIVTEQLIGDEKLLAIMLKCSEQRCKIFGIGKEDKTIKINNLMALSWDDIANSAEDINSEIAELEALPTVKPVKESDEILKSDNS